MGHSYKDQVTAEHDAFCIGSALTSALENARDAGDFTITLDAALESAYGYLAEDIASCRCMFAAMTGVRRIAYLLQFSDDALLAMSNSGYHNDSTGELMTITWDDYVTVHRTREDRNNDWLATELANEIVGDQDSYSAIIASDTEVQSSYNLLVNGTRSEFGTCVNKWGLAYAVARELLGKGIDPEDNTGAITAVLATLDDSSTVVLGNLEFATNVFSETN